MSTNDNPPSIPWWRWPNVLGLDAPLVAVAWHQVLARPGSADPAVSVALFGAVWTIYLADRIFDGRKFRNFPGHALRERHRFCQRHRLAMRIALSVVASATALVAVTRIPPDVQRGGMILSVLVGVYFLWNQFAKSRWGRRWAKELVVALVFAAGCGWTAVAADATALPGTLALASLAFWNCLLVADADRELDIRLGTDSLAGRNPMFLNSAMRLAAVATLGCAAWAVLAGQPVQAAVCTASAVLLCVTALVRRRRGDEAAATWADFALLLPAVVAWSAQ